MAQEIKYVDIELKVNGRCHFYIQTMRKISKYGPSIRQQSPFSGTQKCPRGRIICPYYPATFRHVRGIKRHFRKNKCPNIGIRQGDGIWEDIKELTMDLTQVDLYKY